MKSTAAGSHRIVVANGEDRMGLAFNSMGLAIASQELTRVVGESWGADWAWGIPLVLLTLLIHVSGLGLLTQGAVQTFTRMMDRHHPVAAFTLVIGATTLFATFLLAAEASLWAVLFWILGALPDYESSMLYSLNAITAYGHESLFLEHRWQLLGAIESLNGCLLFGLTTAFLFGMIQKVWSMGRREIL
jgi:hypothetical protein